jgi:hypothetical protein
MTVRKVITRVSQSLAAKNATTPTDPTNTAHNRP